MFIGNDCLRKILILSIQEEMKINCVWYSGVWNIVRVCKNFKQIIDEYIKSLFGTGIRYPLLADFPSKNKFKKAVNRWHIMREPFFSYFGIKRLQQIQSHIESVNKQFSKGLLRRGTYVKSKYLSFLTQNGWTFYPCKGRLERALVHSAAQSHRLYHQTIYKIHKEIDYGYDSDGSPRFRPCYCCLPKPKKTWKTQKIGVIVGIKPFKERKFI